MSYYSDRDYDEERPRPPVSKEVDELKQRLRQAENKAIEYGAVLQWIEDVLDGKDVCEFAESFPLVRRIAGVAHQPKRWRDWAGAHLEPQGAARDDYDRGRVTAMHACAADLDEALRG